MVPRNTISNELNADLAECAREPIHVPGMIQPFGALLAMRADTGHISQVSENTEALLGMEPARVLGLSLAQLVGESTASQIMQSLKSQTWREINPLRAYIKHGGSGPVEYDAIVHRYDGLDFVELEPAREHPSWTPGRGHQVVQGALVRLQQCTETNHLWQLVATEVSRITGFDRVMVYKFDRDEHGMVIAEQKREDAAPYLGLHYPASDIPEQARRLYRVNWIRYIPDVAYAPVRVIPSVDEDHRRLTDLTHSVLRSVSPVHCEYLKNMGVAASMSVSILKNGALWGLIACHHDTPRYIPFEFRQACEMIGQVLSMRIAALEETEDSAYRAKTNSLQARFLAELPNRPNLEVALIAHPPNLLDFIPSDGAAVVYGSSLLVVGKTPSSEQIQTIMRNTLSRTNAPIFATNCLQDRIFEGRDMVDTASGVLCFTVSKAHDFHVFWFRREQVQVVQWGGEPTKPVEVTEGGLRLSPRRSFEAWKQEVRGKSLPWTQSEIEASSELRATLMSLLLAGEPRPGDKLR